MKKVIVGFVLSMSLSFLNAQTGIFKTYEDYVNGNLDKKEDVQVAGAFGSLYYKFTAADNSKITLKPKDFWGFMFKGNLFRSVRGCTAMLQDSGQVCYYLNGEACVDMLHYNRQDAFTFGSTVAFLSSDGMNGKMYEIDPKPFSKIAYRQFRKDFPDYDLYDCLTMLLAEGTNRKKMRKCVQEFNVNYQKKNNK